MYTRILACCLFVSSTSNIALAQNPREILKKAIEAHGGLEQLSKARADWVKLQGTLYLANREIPFVGDTYVQLPDKFRNTMRVKSDKGEYTMVQVLNGKEAWVSLDGKLQKVAPTAAAEMHETMQLDRAIRLVPLLKDRNYQLDYVGESKVRDRKVVGLKVQAKGKKELRLYFDKQTHLLVKTEHFLVDPNKKTIRQEGYFSEFRNIKGYKRPLKMTAYRNGEKVMEAALVEVKYFDKIPDEKFEKP